MAKEKKTLKKFQAVALPKEKAQQVKGGYRDISQFSLVTTAPSFIGWGEIEIRSASVAFSGNPSGPVRPLDI